MRWSTDNNDDLRLNQSLNSLEQNNHFSSLHCCHIPDHLAILWLRSAIYKEEVKPLLQALTELLDLRTINCRIEGGMALVREPRETQAVFPEDA